MDFLLEYWVQVAVLVCVAGGVWFVVRTVRDRAPFLLDEAAGVRASVETDEDGVVLIVGSKRTTMRWPDVWEVRVVTTADGPLDEDLFLDFVASDDSPTVRIPSGAQGFGTLLGAASGQLQGFDIERMLDATVRTDGSEQVVWRRG